MANKKTNAPVVPANFPKPLHDRIIVTAEKPETVTAGGIIIPESASEQQNRGYVMAIGPKVGKGSPVKIKVGDLVEYGEYAGNDISHEGIDYLIMRETDILFIR